ncbi:acetolactate synthase AlsS [Paraburkholderia caribensis]|uniref:acetolactate synthase AlsS n=1 Tax=Paraburkholderia caribensis TaxID=75105 RepID=UPI001D073F3C|nr:acetolactate synthase AlsS [Paraburkholderia caribensis]
MNSNKTGAKLIVESLESMGVTHVFGIPGAKIDSVFDALEDSSIETVVCRHEQNAAFIAGGIGRMTGKAGVALVTSGPGVSNLVTGLATATSEGDPVIGLGGAVKTGESLKQIHQTMDSVALCKPVTKYSAAVSHPSQISEVMANAFRAAETGRPGAAFVSLPADVVTAPSAFEVLPRPRFSNDGPAAADSIEEAARLIASSARPVVLLGLMASKASYAPAVRDFLSQTGIPVVGTFQSAGAVSEQLLDHFGGRVGQLPNQLGDRLIDASDLVITIGYDPVEYWPGLWNTVGRRKIIHIDHEPADLDNHYCPSVELLGNINATLRALAPRVGALVPSPEMAQLLKSVAIAREQMNTLAASLTGKRVHPLRIVHEVQKMMTTDVTLCLDMGSFHLWFARHLYSFRARQMLISNGQQTLGVALPWAIAASLVRPSEKVLSISGDGGFLFSAMELETAVRLKSNIVHLVLIDGSYDMVAVQEEAKYRRKSGVELGPVDPVKYAEAFGATGMMVRNGEELGPVLHRAFDIEGPVLIGMHVDYSDNHKLFDPKAGRLEMLEHAA